MFSLKKSRLEKMILMHRKVNAPEAYDNVIRTIGAPNKTVTDNAMVIISKIWTSVNPKYCIGIGLIVSYHRQQNYVEGMGDNNKFAILKLFYNTPLGTISVLVLCYQLS